MSCCQDSSTCCKPSTSETLPSCFGEAADLGTKLAHDATDQDRRDVVRQGYQKVAENDQPSQTTYDIALSLGYTEDDLAYIGDSANLALGCGNPIAAANLTEGETVVDLGSGAGIDCLLASRQVGPKGKVIGIDFTPEMIKRAQANASAKGVFNTEFLLGDLVDLPVDDNTVDCVISNCVINLVPEKELAFSEAYRILKPGGRLIVSDMVLLKPISPEVRSSAACTVGCIAGAVMKDEYLNLIHEAGFETPKTLESKYIRDENLTRHDRGRITVDKYKFSSEFVEGPFACALKVFAIKTK
ncbi:hypothetical protein GEMRC1_003039 [Eukaryota sp. GEM-RC1]